MTIIRTLFLAVPLLLGAAFGASAAPHKANLVAKPVMAAPAAVSGGSFRDVSPGHWAAQSVETLRRAGIVRGYPPVRK